MRCAVRLAPRGWGTRFATKRTESQVSRSYGGQPSRAGSRLSTSAALECNEVCGTSSAGSRSSLARHARPGRRGPPTSICTTPEARAAHKRLFHPVREGVNPDGTGHMREVKGRSIPAPHKPHAGEHGGARSASSPLISLFLTALAGSRVRGVKSVASPLRCGQQHAVTCFSRRTGNESTEAIQQPWPRNLPARMTLYLCLPIGNDRGWGNILPGAVSRTW